MAEIITPVTHSAQRELSERALAMAPRQPAPADQPERLIPWSELRKLVPYTRQHLLRLEKQGLFPRRIYLSERRVVWRASVIAAWIAEREAA